MQKLTISTVLLSQMFFFVFAADFPVKKITALKSPVWLQQGVHKSQLNSDQKLKPGDKITTGNSGQVEIQMGLASTLLLYPDSEISIKPEEADKSATQSQPLILVIHRGKSCFHSKQVAKYIDKIDIYLGSSLVSPVSFNYDICVQREGSLSSVNLRNGSVQINHSKEGVFILSEQGIQLHIDDDGSFKLIASDSVDKETKNKAENVLSSSPGTKIKVGTSITHDERTEKETNTTPTAIRSTKHYNVYLFSTLDEALAEQVNQRFHQANLNSRIIIVDWQGTSRYRIAVPGFESLEEAQAFSESVMGKLGISNTWIGQGKVFSK
jgi:hypothetical protein